VLSDILALGVEDRLRHGRSQHAGRFFSGLLAVAAGVVIARCFE
jgi:hypothetical protein